MEKSNKRLSIIAFIFSIICLSVGFMAYSSTVIISSTVATPQTNLFKVAFTGDVTCTQKGGAIVNSSGIAKDTTVSGININFTAPGQSVTCKTTIENTGGYVAYLNSITMDKVGCEIISQDKNNIVNKFNSDICKGINVSVYTNSVSVTSTIDQEGKLFNITGESLPEKNGLQHVYIDIKYKSSSTMPTESFNINVPQATLTYSSVD